MSEDSDCFSYQGHEDGAHSIWRTAHQVERHDQLTYFVKQVMTLQHHMSALQTHKGCTTASRLSTEEQSDRRKP